MDTSVLRGELRAVDYVRAMNYLFGLLRFRRDRTKGQCCRVDFNLYVFRSEFFSVVREIYMVRKFRLSFRIGKVVWTSLSRFV